VNHAPVAWFTRVDRTAELRIAREAAVDGGLRVMVAQEGQGGAELARLIAETVRAQGRMCVIGRDTQAPDALKGAILHAYRQLINPRPGAIAVSSLVSGESLSVVADDLRLYLDAQAPRPVIVLEAVDSNGPLGGQSFNALDRLADGEQSVVVVTARGSGTPWRSCRTARKIRALSSFRFDDIMATAATAPNWPPDTSGQQRVGQRLRDTLGAGPVRPDEAFAALAALS